MPLSAGSRIGGFEILEPLGAGGMGEVYRAREASLEREVAVKVLPAESLGDAAARARLIREAKLASSLNHPNICTVHQVGEDRGQVFIAMELAEGLRLSDRISSGGLPTDSVIRYGVQIADALAHAHARGVIHRDLKGSNVVITRDDRVKVLDFGLARRIEPAEGDGAMRSAALTSTGMIVGTPQALAPEVLGGEPADTRSDLWSVGVLLYEMACGGLPFRGDSLLTMMAAVLHQPHVPLPERVPLGLRAVIDRCLAKDPNLRYQSAEEVRAALESSATGKRRALRRRLIPIAAVVVLVAFALPGLWNWIGREGVPIPGRIRSLAVLPLENLSGDPSREYFADGMTEELITSLAGLEGVRVISRTSIMRYKRTTKPIQQIGRELNVDAIVAGSALHAGDRVRVSAQLIHVSDDRHLWANRYDRTPRDVLGLQDEVAEAIATEIRATLRPHVRARPAVKRTVNPEAYDLTLQGRYEWNQRTRRSILKAIPLFERAIAIDPNYAAAHAGLAEALVIVNNYTDEPTRETWPKALRSATRAMELDDRNAEAHAIIAQLRYRFEFDWTRASTSFRRALELNPSNATILQWHGLYLAHAGRLQEAAEELARARRLDPFSRIIRLNQGQVEYWRRRPDRALAYYQEALAIDPGFEMGHHARGWALLAQDRYAEALRAFQTADSVFGGGLTGDPAIRTALARGNLKAYWTRVTEIEEAQAALGQPRCWSLAICYGQLGARDQALRWLQRSFDDREAYLLFALRGPAFDPLRSDPRIRALLRRHGLA